MQRTALIEKAENLYDETEQPVEIVEMFKTRCYFTPNMKNRNMNPVALL